jgi:MerR family transcriptional regulator, heat shock protein HspR
MEKETVYSIGEAADILGVSVPTLRLYERAGLILPIRKNSKHRLYTENDLNRVRCLRQSINHKKISIAGIRSLLSTIPCWSIKECPDEIRRACPAFQSPDAPCWTVEGKPWDCSRSDCRVCSVYVESSDCQRVKQIVAQHTTGSNA